MSEDAKSKVEINQTLFDKVIPQPLEKIITAVLAKMKTAWLQENTLSGIQFYGDIED